MRILLVLALFSATAFAAHTPVGWCESPGQPALGIVQIGVTPEATFYLDDRGYPFGYGITFYQESNGIWSSALDWEHNLQRGGWSPYIPSEGDYCVDDPLVVPDVLFN